MSDHYIELNRTFHEISLSSGDSDEFDYRSLRYGESLSWQDILVGHRTIILSEAGSGKTEEIRHAAQTLRGEGKAAFFLRLEHVAEEFEIAFEEGNLAAFDQWIVSGEEGWLFLDSVDEARLREPKDFERAIRKVSVRLAAAMQRTHIVITSRGSAWRPVTDLRFCQQQLPYVAPVSEDAKENQDNSDGDTKDRGPFKIVALDDLGSEQASLFANAKGITNPTKFLNAIERADAWSMAARPDDLTELVQFWIKNQRIGNRLELMQSSIDRRLLERDQTRAEASPLSAKDARDGARSVAAAATMAQESTIRVPDGSDNTNGLAVSAILPGWDDKKCAALLARPIFDEAIYRTVRFHHRTVREYLTAEWFKHLLDHETSRRKIEGAFFREQYGQEVLVPAMRPVLVWLILLDDKIRERALAISPELIFEGGEPKALPLATRQAILREVCQKMDTSITRGSTTDYRAVQRFADKDIAADIKALFATYAKSDDLQRFLLRMVWQGELSDVLPEAKQAAMNPGAGHYPRVAAIRAVRAIGADADRLELRQRFLAEGSQLSRELFAELMDGLPATRDAMDWALACLAKLKQKDRFKSDALPHALNEFIQGLSLDMASGFLTGLNRLIGKRPVVERRFCEISKRYGWLMEAATCAAERLILARHPTALLPPVLSVLQRLPLMQMYHDWDMHGVRSDASKLVPAWPELNQALLWFEVAQARRYRAKKSERVTEYWQASTYGSYAQFKPEDFDRVLSDITSRPQRDDRLVALSLAFHLYGGAGRPAKWRAAMKSAVAAHRYLRDALDHYLHPAQPTAEQRRWRRQHAAYERQHKAREITDAKNKQEWRDYIVNHTATLRDPGLPDRTVILNTQHYLHEKVREADPQSSQWTYGKWQVLEPEFGAAVARAFRDGVVAYWRRYRPRLRSEGKANNSTPFPVIFGLTGLNIESRETEDWVSTLSASEAELAFRYAMDELNGFPDWFPSLFDTFADVVTPLILHEIDWNLRASTTKQELHYILADLSWSGKWAWSKLGQGVLDRLTQREPKNLTNLGYMLTILQGAGVEPVDVAKLAAIRSADRRIAHAAHWFAVWVGIAPDVAIPALSARLAAMKNSISRTTVAMQFLTHLLGGRRNESHAGPAFRTPQHLQDLYVLMHRYIREKDDIHRAGKGVFSPGLRDDAQDSRNHLFTLLKEIPGKEAYLALMELVKFHPEPSSRPWMHHHAKSKAEKDADLTPWTIEQTRDFQVMHERTPANHRELFELAEMRFLDLKDNLEHGDSSIADILIKGATLETDMRKYIGEWLRDRANGRYSLPQEEEYADSKRVDFRMHGNGFDAPLPVELKLADKWAGPKLFERLENQLCGDYLRDNRSNRGLFVLVYRGEEKQGWELPGGGKKVDFSGLVATLQDHWSSISDRFPHVDDIRVVGIDLTLRHPKVDKPKKPRAKKAK